MTDALARIAPGLSLPELIGKSALFGVAGWGMHNVLFKPRALEVTIDDADPTHRPPTHPIRIPFLPVYAVGGAAVLVAAQAVVEALEKIAEGCWDSTFCALKARAALATWHEAHAKGEVKA